MPVTACGLTIYSQATEGTALSCAQWEANQVALQSILSALCDGPTQEYFNSHASATINIAGSLPTEKNKIKVYYNGNRLYDNDLSGLANGYTVSGSTITLSFTPPGGSSSNFMVEWWPL